MREFPPLAKATSNGECLEWLNSTLDSSPLSASHLNGEELRLSL